ncbi:MAG: DcaP family trimeric outer membrane transporter [Pseudomonadota bacterium]
MSHRQHIRRPLALSLLVCLLAPGLALAQDGTPREAQLEARVAELEKLVQQLIAQQQAAPAPAPKPADDGKPRIQSAPIMSAANPGTRFSYGGFVKLDAMVTDTSDGEIADGSVGRMFYVPSTIPVGSPGANESTDTDMGAQFSRFWFGADTDLDSGDKLKGYLEFDLFGGGSINGNEVATNTYGVSVRQAYVSWTRPDGSSLLAGQTWSNFQDVASLPDSVDFVGPTEGTVFVRQAQVRYTKGPWSFSVENPETTVTPYRGIGARISSDDNLMPDLTARWQKKGDWGHVSVAGMVRQFAYENPASGIDDTTTGGAVSVSGRFNFGKNDDLRYMATYGRGIGRYLGLGIASDTVLDASGELEPIDGYGAFAAWRHAFSPKLRGNVFYSMAHFDNDAALTGLAATERAQSFHVNLIYSPVPKLDIGAELIWGERSLENELDGDLRRFHTHVKYSF